MEAPPDAPIAGHTQGDNIGQRARQQAKAAHVNRPCEQYRRRDIVEQQNSRGHITDHLRQANSSKPQSTAGEGPHPAQHLVQRRKLGQQMDVNKHHHKHQQQRPVDMDDHRPGQHQEAQQHQRQPPQGLIHLQRRQKHHIQSQTAPDELGLP